MTGGGLIDLPHVLAILPHGTLMRLPRNAGSMATLKMVSLELVKAIGTRKGVEGTWKNRFFLRGDKYRKAVYEPFGYVVIRKDTVLNC